MLFIRTLPWDLRNFKLSSNSNFLLAAIKYHTYIFTALLLNVWEWCLLVTHTHNSKQTTNLHLVARYSYAGCTF